MNTASITVMGVPMVVQFEFDAAEPAVLSGPFAGPGWPASVEVICAKLGEHELTDLLSASAVDAIEDALLAFMGEVTA